MAEELLTNIEIDTGKATDRVDELTDSLKRNAKQTRAIEKELKKLEKEYKSIATAVKKVPTDQVSRLNKEVKKSDKALSKLGGQLDKTAGKMNRVKERTVGATDSLTAMATVLAGIAAVDAIEVLAGRVNSATSAVVRFNESVVPMIEDVQRFSKRAAVRMGESFTQIKITALSAKSALMEQVATMKGLGTGTKRSQIFMKRFNETLKKVGKTAQSTGSTISTLKTFVAQSREEFGRVKTLLRGLKDNLNSVRNTVVAFQQAWFGTFGPSSGGAAQVNKFQKLIITFQWHMENLSKTIKGGVAKGFEATRAIFTRFGAGLQNILENGFKLNDLFGGKLTKGLEVMSKGFVDAGVKGFDLLRKFDLMKGGLLGVIEGSTAVGFGLFGLGAIIKSTDNKVLDFIGSLVQMVGILSISFGAAATVAIGVIGQLVSAIGDKLLMVMAKWEEKFIKVQAVTKAFEFVVKGFGKAVSTAAVGSVQFWNKTITQMTKTTAFGAAEIQKGVKILIAEGQALGLTAEQNAMILQRVSDIAAVTGNKFADVSLSVAKALAGQAGTLDAFGIFTDKVTLKYSKFGKELDKGIESLNKNEKAMLVMNSVMEQTIPITGFAADQLNTVAGASKQLSQSLDTLAAKLGTTNKISLAFTQIQNNLVQALIDMPTAVHDIISVLVEWGGFLLKILGTLISLSITIITVKGAIEFLNFAIVKSATVTKALNFLLGIAATKLDITLIKVTNLKTALIATSTAIKAGMVQGFKQFIANAVTASKAALKFAADIFFTQAGLTGLAIRIDTATAALLKLNARMLANSVIMRKRVVTAVIAGATALKGFVVSTFFTIAGLKGLAVGLFTVTKAMLRFTVALLTNPLVIKAAFIVGAIVLLVKAYKSLKKELGFLSKGFFTLGKEAKKAKPAVDFGKALATTFKFAVDVVKLIIIGVMTLIKVVQASVKGFQLMKAKLTGNKEEIRRLNAEAGVMREQFGQLAAVSNATQNSIAAGWGGVAMAADGAGKAMDDLKDKIKSVSIATGEITFAKQNALMVAIFGDEVDKANLKLTEAKRFMTELTDFGVIKIGTEVLLPTEANLKALSKGLLDKGKDKAVRAPATSVQADQALFEVTKAQAEIDKKRIDLRTQLTKVIQAQNVEALKGAGKTIEAIQKQGQIELLQFQKRAAMYAKIETLSTKERRLLGKVEAGIKAVTAAKVADARAAQADAFATQLEKENQKRQKALKDQLKLIKDLRKEAAALNAANIRGSGDRLAIAKFELDTRMMDLAMLEKRLKGNKAFLDDTGKLKKNYMDMLATARALAAQKFEDAQPFTVGDLLGTLGEAFSKAKTFTKGLFSADGMQKVFASAKNLFSADGMKNALKDGATFLKDGLKAGWEMVKDIDLGSALGAAGEGLMAGMSGIMSMFDPKAIMGLADSLGDLDKLPQALLKAFNKLIQNMDKIIDGLVDAFVSFLDQLPFILEKILDMIPALIDSISDVAEKLIDKIPFLVARILDALPGILSRILERLPSIIFKLLSAIGNIIGQLIQAIPGLVVQILEALPSIILAVVDGLLNAMDFIAIALTDFMIDGIPRIIVALVKAIPKVAVAIVQGIVRGLARSLGRLFGGIKMPESLTELPKKFEEGINKLAKKATEEAGKLFKVLDLEAEVRGADKAKQMEDIFNRGVKGMVIAFKGLFATLKAMWDNFIAAIFEAWMWVKTNILDPIFNVIKDAWMWVWDNVISPIATAVSDAWGWVVDNVISPLALAVSDAWQWVVDNVIDPLVSFIKDTTQPVFEALISGFEAFVEFIQPVFEVFADAIKAWGDFIAPVFVAFQDAIKAWGDFIAPVFQAFQDSLQPFVDAFQSVITAIKSVFQGGDVIQSMKDAGGQIWQGLKDMITGKNALTAFQALGQGIYDKFKNLISHKDFKKLFTGFGTNIWSSLKTGLGGITKIVQDALDAVKPNNLMPKMFQKKGSWKGKGAVEKVIGLDVPYVKFSQGGLVRGLAKVSGDHSKNDTVPAMLSPGEAVIPRSKMKDPMVVRVVEQILKGELRGFFGGGGGGISVSVPKPPKVTKPKIVENIQKEAGKVLEALNPKEEIMKHIRSALRTMMKLHSGGMVPGFAYGGEVPAMLQSGEYVMNRGAVSRLGTSFMDNVNRGQPGTTETNVELGGITINTTQNVDQAFIRSTLMPMVKRELKESSLRGEFLISKKGLRKT